MKPAPSPDVDRTVDVLLLDNRDSFTWNLAQGFLELGATVEVIDADAITAPAILSARPRLVCIGPGPRGPSDLPHLLDVVRGLAGEVPLFGVCLGMQAMVRALGGTVGRAVAPVHGKRCAITHDDVGVLRGLPSPLWVMRYHSLVTAIVPDGLAITARDGLGQAMALRGRGAGGAMLEAVQFHPESMGTAGGMHILANALGMVGITCKAVVPRRGSVPPPGSLGPGHPEASYGPAPSLLEVP